MAIQAYQLNPGFSILQDIITSELKYLDVSAQRLEVMQYMKTPAN